MKNKKHIILFICLFLIILVSGIFLIKYLNEKKQNSEIEEYIPEEEFTETDNNRQTIVTLYFINQQTSKLMPEARMVDVKEMLDNPYMKLLNLLIEGPKNQDLSKSFPENTKILEIKKDGDTLIINLSKEFIESLQKDENIKNLTIKSIVNTETELTEINKVKFLIEGEENEQLNEVYEREST